MKSCWRFPDVTYLKENIDKVKGFVITHGHEDHIGALPYILKEVNVPVYATKLTIGLIENKLKEHNLLRTTKRKIIKHGQSINLGAFRIEFIKTNHSIADAAALAIYSPAGIIVHTGDFKVDYTPVFGDVIDLQRFAEIGKKGVLALMCDSTNAERPAPFSPPVPSSRRQRPVGPVPGSGPGPQALPLLQTSAGPSCSVRPGGSHPQSGYCPGSARPAG